ncbi:DMT family transporter [Legionella israelensis]|uniref:ABC transporter permease n=1 Tax=Legionella israelensis TaxID=454 RepID=A0A0W0WBJ9_9GAMM|nr:DMT family transporter [Legionella israelensis]KTD29735.1 ABC transporter permease [Legionella israelensis]QBS08861.1 DMT family transporter [Legionella israelensis]SCY02426.1 Permease of the drug/metabolite transporter (DMT) superfamily [Legionella israelensis DSM 19235]STX58546.1 ABC transporter, transmembrane permease,permeases of drug/metabolite transporter type [Legionella israelensis]
MFKISTLKSLLLLILLGFIWGSGYSLAKYAMTHGVPPLGYAFWQALGPAVLLFSVCFASRQYSPLQKTNWPYFIICGLIGIAIPNTNMYFISSHISAGMLAVLVNTVPLMVYPLALVSGLEKPDFCRFFALILGMVGIVLIIKPASHPIVSGWSLLALLSPLAFAICSIYIAKYKPSKVNSLQAATGMLIAASLLLTPLVFQQKAFYPLTPPFTLTKQVILLEIILSSIGYLIFFMLIRLAGPVFYSLTGGIVALTGLFWGYIVFAEKPDFSQMMAVSCIIAAIFLLSWRQSKQQGV